MKSKISKPSKLLLYFLILLNLFDIVLHVAIGQPETLRITANALIVASSGCALLAYRTRLMLIIGLTFYLILNCIFIVLNGIGSAGVVFISITTALALAALILYRTE